MSKLKEWWRLFLIRRLGKRCPHRNHTNFTWREPDGTLCVIIDCHDCGCHDFGHVHG